MITSALAPSMTSGPLLLPPPERAIPPAKTPGEFADWRWQRDEVKRLVCLMAPEQHIGLAWTRVYARFSALYGIHPEALQRILGTGTKLGAIEEIGALGLLLENCVYPEFNLPPA